MSRAFTEPAVRSMLSRETDQVYLQLLTIAAEGLEEPIRVTNDTQPVTSRGLEFVVFPFDFILPETGTAQLPEIQLSIANADPTILNSLRSLTSLPELLLEIVLADTPDVVEMSIPGLRLEAADYTADTISGTLTAGHQLQRIYPGYRFSKTAFPGLYR
jgi:hypothetical protein